MAMLSSMCKHAKLGHTPETNLDFQSLDVSILTPITPSAAMHCYIVKVIIALG